MRTNAANPSPQGAVFDADADLIATIKTLLGATRFYPAAVGRTYSADTLCTGTRTTSQTYQQLVVAPVWSGPDGFTINGWSVNVATAAASAVYRIGAWTIDNQHRPFAWVAGTKYATLLHDVGLTATADCSTTGAKVVSDTFTFAPNTWLLIGGALQGATGAQLTIGTNSGGVHSPYGLGTAGLGLATVGAIGLAQNTVTGAFGDFTPAAASSVGHGVALNRSA